ncbi:hypothetical protein M3Y14_34265 (plasmid) [Bacillus thuringiensis]|uniref:LPD28 domain-containing protein n=1 Tax=Bacillus thuringiensis TaxID=1428 RepID=UPI0022253CA8|nr:LPD28 domain-containing protein [Bacillus thuringiensis]UYX56048.1 hypothetical protein M3Y14_34265 [Bacillus thuringiensis]
MSNTQAILFELRGIPVVTATSLRIPQEERNSDLYYYDIRHADCGWCEPATIEPFVMVNHYGTITTTLPLELNDGTESNQYLVLTDEEGNLISQYA